MPGSVIAILTEKVNGELEMLERHLVILKLAEETKIPSHKVRYSLRVLEQEGLIKASSPGAVTTERTGPFLAELESMIQDLIKRAGDLKRVKIAR